MAQQIINVGTAPNIGNGEPVRDGFGKAISNVEELAIVQNIDVESLDLPNIGSLPNDHTGDLIIIAFEKLKLQIGALLNPIPEGAIQFEGTSEYITFEGDEENEYITFETIE